VRPFALTAAFALVLTPIELGMLVHAAHRVTGRWSPRAVPTVLANRQRLGRWVLLVPVLFVVDIRLPPGFTDEGLRAAVGIRRERRLPILVLSQYVEAAYARDLLSLGGGSGYLLKDRISRPGQLVEALATVAAGGTVLDPEAVAQMFASDRTRGALATLTDRERERTGSARCSSTWRRAGPVPRSPRSWSSRRPPCTNTSAASSRSSACHRPTTIIAGSSRCSPISTAERAAAPLGCPAAAGQAMPAA